MRVSEVIARLREFPDYYDVPDVVDVRVETRVTTRRDLATGARVTDAAIVVVIC